MLDNKIINQVVSALLNQNGGSKTLSKLYGTVEVVDGKKYVKLDGSDSLTAIVEGTEVMAGDRVLVSIENHQAVVISNITSPASARTATNFMDFTEEGLIIGQMTGPDGIPQSIVIGSLDEGEEGIYLRVGNDVIAKFIGDEYGYSKIEFGPFIPSDSDDEYLAFLDSDGLNIYKNYRGYDDFDECTRISSGFITTTDSLGNYIEMLNGSVHADNGCNAKVIYLTASATGLTVSAGGTTDGGVQFAVPVNYTPIGILAYEAKNHPCYFIKTDLDLDGKLYYKVHNPSSTNWTGVDLSFQISCVWTG